MRVYSRTQRLPDEEERQGAEDDAGHADPDAIPPRVPLTNAPKKTQDTSNLSGKSQNGSGVRASENIRVRGLTGLAAIAAYQHADKQPD